MAIGFEEIKKSFLTEFNGENKDVKVICVLFFVFVHAFLLIIALFFDLNKLTIFWFLPIITTLFLLGHPFISLLLCLFLIFSGFSEISYLSQLHPVKLLTWVLFTSAIIGFSQRKLRLKLILPDYMLLLFILYLPISAIFSYNTVLATKRLYWLFRTYAFYFIVRLFLSDRGQIRWVFLVVILSALGSILYTIATSILSNAGLLALLKIGGIWRGSALFPNPNLWGATLLISLGFTGYLFEERKINRVLLIVIFTLILFGIFITYSRGTFIAFGIMILFFIFRKFRYRGLIIAVFFTSILLIVVWNSPYFMRYKTILLALFQGTVDTSIRERVNLLSLAVDLFKRNSLIGVGPGYFLEFSSAVASGNKQVHNLYLEILCETGIIGGVFYFTALLSTVILAYRDADTLTYYMGMLFIVILVLGMVLSLEFRFFFGAIWGIVNSVNSFKKVKEKQKL